MEISIIDSHPAWQETFLAFYNRSFLEVVEPGLSWVDSVEGNCCPQCVWLLGAGPSSLVHRFEHLWLGCAVPAPHNTHPKVVIVPREILFQ